MKGKLLIYWFDGNDYHITLIDAAPFNTIAADDKVFDEIELFITEKADVSDTVDINMVVDFDNNRVLAFADGANEAYDISKVEELK